MLPIVVHCLNPLLTKADKHNHTYHTVMDGTQKWAPGRPRVFFHHETLQKFDREFEDSVVIYRLYNVSYYLSNHHFKNRGRHAFVHAVSIRFPLFGKVYFLWDEGWCQVAHGSRIIMQARNNAAPYEHPNTYHTFTSMTDFAFYKVGSFIGHVDDFDLQLVPCIGMTVEGAIQANWILDHVDIQSFPTMRNHIIKKWTPRAISKETLQQVLDSAAAVFTGTNG